MKKNLLLVFDTHALIHRAYHAFPPLTNSEGLQLNAVYGFCMMFLRSIKQFDPEYVICTSDASEMTFRKEKVQTYKANRAKIPDDLIEQIKVMKEVIKTFNLPLLEIGGYEADDIVGTIVKKLEHTNTSIRIITGDRDLLQLINLNTKVVLPGKSFSDVKIYSEKEFEERFGFPHENYVDYKSIVGDASDNIIGIKGVGEKTASDLVKRYGTLEKIIENLDNEKPRVQKLFADCAEKVAENRFLATINRDVPIEVKLDEARLKDFKRDDVIKMFERFEFKSLMKMIPESSYTAQLSFGSEEQVEVLTKSEFKGEEVVMFKDTDGIIFYDPKNKERFTYEGDVKDILESKFINKIGIDIKKLGHPFNLPYEDVRLMQYSFDSRFKVEVDSPESIYSLYLELKEKLSKEEKLDKIYTKIERPLARILYEMETDGILVDKNRLEKLDKEYEVKIQEVKQKIFEAVGHEFNPASPKELGKILFEELNLPKGKKTKTGYSTDENVLEKLVGTHPVIELIRSFRECAKIRSTYIVGLLKSIGHDGRIHTDYSQALVPTGRLSSNNPNLQNIPAKNTDIKEAFIAPDGYKLISFDYSQIELRVMAHLANDPTMIKSFQNGEDIHAATAALLFGKKLDEITKSDRSFAKTINFGILYGMGEFGLAMRSEMDIKEARKFIKEYWEKFPSIKKYFDEVLEGVKTKGYAETLFGRRRHFDFEHMPYMRQQAIIREAINMPVQGTAADIMKLAMIRVWKDLEKYNARMLLQIHDELVFEIKDDEKTIKEFTEYVTDGMDNVIALKVPMSVGVGMGKNLAEVK